VSGATTNVWFVYMLRCADATLYTGITNRLSTRLTVHNAGRGAKYTRGRLPVELVYRERVAGRSAALHREAEIKRLPTIAKRKLAAGGIDERARRPRY